MTTIVLTVKPVHLSDIRAGCKLEEVRKSIPKGKLPIRVLCCESGSEGQIKCEFILDKYRVETVESIHRQYPPCMPRWNIIPAAQISLGELEVYMGTNPFRKICFWHISRMVDYCSTPGYRVRHISELGLKRAPQSWCYVKEVAGWQGDFLPQLRSEDGW